MCKFNPKNDSRRIDPCMKNFITFLEKHLDFPLVACCCGHNKYPMTAILNIRPTIIHKSKFVEIVSGVELPRKKKFYKKDKQGVYYIPEIIEQLKLSEEKQLR